MVDIRPNALPEAILPLRSGDAVIVDQGADGVRQTDPISMTDSVAPVASQAEAVAGVDNVKRMTPLRTKQSIASEVGVTLASNAQGEKADSAVQSVNGKSGNSVTIDKVDVGLGNVDNTSDLNKPISTATQTALDLKANDSVVVKSVNGVTPTSGNVNVSAQETRLQDTVSGVNSEDYGIDAQFVVTSGYYSAGDNGGANYRRKSPIEVDSYGDITSNGGTVRWALVGNEFFLKQFGAIEGQDVAEIVEGALTLGAPIRVDGIYTASRMISYLGAAEITATEYTSEIHWPATATTSGIYIKPQDWYQLVTIRGVRFTSARIGVGNAIRVDWSDLTMAGLPFFWVKSRITYCIIQGTTAPGGIEQPTLGWKNGVYLDRPFSVEVEDNYIRGCWDGTFNTNGINAFIGDNGIYIPDQSWRTLAYFSARRNTLFYWKRGMLLYNVEGMWLEDNDFQVDWYGIWIQNTISPVNQYRVRGNHIGVYDTGFYCSNARQLLFIQNEVSYRSGRTGGGALSQIVLDGVYSYSIIGNSIRGNVFNTTDVAVDGIRLLNSGQDVGNTRRGTIDSNQFQNMRYAYNALGTGNESNIFGPSNTYDNMMGGTFAVTESNASIAPGRMGSGTMPIPVGQNPALWLSNKSAASLSIGRETNDGTVVGFFREGVGSLVGSISISTTATAYNQTSDALLKDDEGELSFEDAKRVIQLVAIHNFSWKETGERDTGVFAQELYKVHPRSVTKGGWFMPENDSSEVPEGTEGAYYRPWMVDYSKLVPVIIRVIQGLIQ